MIRTPRWKIFTILAVCLAGVVFAIPNILTASQLAYLPSWMTKTVNLGLELRGGSHLQLEVDLKSVEKDQMTSLMDEVRTVLRKEQVGYTGLIVDISDKKPKVVFVLRDMAQKDKVAALLRKLNRDAEIDISDTGRVSLSLSEVAVELNNRAAVDKSIEVVRHRIDETGTKEPLIQRQGHNRIIVQLPGVEDPAEVRKLIGKTAKLRFSLVDHTAGPVQISASGVPQAQVPAGSEILPETRSDGSTGYLIVKKNTALSGETLVDAQATIHNGKAGVSITFNTVGARKFAEISANNINKQFAIILDNKIISAPVFNEPIPNGQASITGHFTVKEANDLSLLLRAGSLPAPLHVIEERTVGPSLGADSIHDGRNATLLAFVFVAVFMFLGYSLFGLFADIALVFNLIGLFAALSLLQATLTLPGIAGIALTIGMAVDANVLIYERIKEELRNGLRPIAAIEAGYARAFTTIIDSNLTTLIGAAVLFEFGTGPIRGFAVTLSLGILISLFSALSLTRLIIMVWLRGRNVTSLPI